MAEQTIDKISIEIKTRADESVKSIEKLTLALVELEDYATPTATGLSNLKTALSSLNKPLANMNKSYSTSAKSIEKFGDSLGDLTARISTINTSGFNSLLKGFRELSEVAKYTTAFTKVREDIGYFGKSMNSLEKSTKILPKVVQAFRDLNIEPMVRNMRELTKIMTPFNEAMSDASFVIKLFGSTMTKLPSTFDRVESKFDRLRDKGDKLSNSLSRIASIQTLQTAYNVVERLTDGLMGFVNRSMEYTENINLFNVAMGGYAETAGKFIEQLDRVGVDPAEATRMQGLFFQISESLGLASEKAYVLSENFTKLTYDLSSFFNIGTQEAFEKLRAGLVGETEPLRQLGIVITENNLAETARRLGIEQSIRTMTEAQKIELRYVTALYQSVNAHNDLERTILSPANAMRLLQAEFAQTARAIGDLFIPILIKVLPYITAFVRLIGQAVSALASFFGFEMPKIENSVGTSFGGVSDQLKPAVEGTENMGKNLNSATKSAKELKRQLMGFDELNVITSPSPTGGAGGGGGGGGLGGIGGMLDDLLSLEDFLSAGYDQLFLDVTDSVSRLMGKIKELAKTWIPILGGALAGLMAVKVYDWFTDLVDGATDSNGALKLFGKSVDLTKSPIEILKGLLMQPKVGLVASVGLLAYNLIDVAMNSDTFQRAMKFIGDSVNDLQLKLPSFNLDFGGLKTLFDDVGLSMSTIITVAGGLAGAFLGVPFAGIAVTGGLTIGMFELLGKSMETPVDKIDVFKTGLSDTTTQAMIPFSEALRELEGDIKLVSMDDLITEEEIATLQAKLTGITESVINKLNADRNEELQNLETLKHFMGDKEYEEAVARINTRYDGMITEMQGKNGEMLQTIDDFQNGRITKEEMYEKIRLEVLKDVWDKGTMVFSENQVEMETIRRRASEQMDAIDLDSAVKLLERAKKLKDDTIQVAQDEFDKQVSIVSLKWDTMSKEEQDFYKDTLTKAHAQKEKMIKNTQEQYDELGKELRDGMGEQGKRLDIENAKLFTKHEAYWSNTKVATGNHYRVLGNTTITGWDNINAETQKAMDKMSGSQYTMTQKQTQQYSGMYKDINKEQKSGNSIIEKESTLGLDALIKSTKKELPKVAQAYKDSFNKDVKPQFSDTVYKPLGTDSANSLYNGANNGLRNNANSLRNSIQNNFTNIFKSEVNKVNNMKASVPTPDGGKKSLKAFNIPMFARGGMPNVGSLFMAGENGTELIGKFGSRETVMPLEDSGFVDAMYNAVYEAISSAIGGLESGDVVLQVGEEELGRSAIKGINRVTNKVGHTLLKI